MTTPTHASVNDPPVQRRPGLVQAMLTPWRAILSPRAQSSPLADCSGFFFWTTFALHTLLLVGIVIALTVWSGTVTVTWTQSQPPMEVSMVSEVQEWTWSHVWTAWTNQRGAGPYLTAMLLAGVTFVGHIVLAWLYLPDVHEGGSVVRSFGRTFRGVVGSIGMLTAIVSAFGFVIVENNRVGMLYEIYGWGPYLMVAGFALAGVQIAWIRRTCEGARRAADASELPPMCEDCGYDLTHRPESGRCTECGGDIRTSLTPGARRNACAWERSTIDAGVDPASGWLLCLGGEASSLVLEPVRFYRGLAMRSDLPRAVSFARWQYVLMAGTAVVWALVSGVCLGFDGEDLLLMPTFVGVLTLSLGWLVHRTVAAIALSYCFVRGMLPDPRYARKVFAYETAFLWVFCLYNGFLVTTFLIWDMWMSDLLGFGIRWLGGMPPEVAAMFFGNGAIALGWLYRYRLIIPQVRWANS